MNMIKIIDVKRENLKQELYAILSSLPREKIKSVFIKPNLGGRFPIIKGENNEVGFVRLLCEVLTKAGTEEIIIGHSSLIGFGYSKYCLFEDIVKINGYDQLLCDRKIKLLNTDSIERCPKESGGFSFLLPKMLETWRYLYLNVCKMKTHMETGVSLSMKNQMGLLTFEDRKKMHKTNIHLQIANLSDVLKPDLNIIDGIIGMEGNGPHHGNSIKSGLVLVGTDMIELDSVCCNLMGIEIEEVDHLREALKKRRIMRPAFEFAGKKRLNYKKPSKVIKKGSCFYVNPTTACSGCIFSLSRAFDDLLKKHPIAAVKKLFFQKTSVYIGQCMGISAAVDHKNTRFIGNCTKGYAKKNGAKYLKGCPPTIDEIVDFLRD